MGLEGYSAGWCPGLLAVDLGISGVIQDIYEGDTAYRSIGCFVHAGAVGGIDERQTLNVARNTGTVYTLGTVVVMGRRRENEEGEGNYRAPALESQPIRSHAGELSTSWESCQAAS